MSKDNFEDRKNDARGRRPQRKSARRAIAENVSRQTKRTKKAEIINEALAAFVILLYEKDDVGYTSFDLDGMILVPAPWSKKNHTKWGLRRLEANVLRYIIKEESENNSRTPLFFLDNFRWYVNATSYARKSQALAWVEEINITANRWERGRLAVTDETARKWTS